MSDRHRKAQDYLDIWDGGFIRRDSKGRKVFIIRRMMNGRVYKVSTRAHTETAAMEQLKRFESDPDNFEASGTPADSSTATIVLDAALALQFLTWARDVKKNSPLWLGKQRGYLEWWCANLKGVDLRKASLADHLLPPLDKAKARAHRIAVIKSVYSWLRKERHVLAPHEDPTFGTLAVPQSDPTKRRIKNKSFPKEHYVKVRAELDGHWRDALDTQAGTGWHITEVKRFAETGVIEPAPAETQMKGIAGVLVCPQTKRGNEHRTAVSKAVLTAAQRLRKHNSLSIEKYGLAVKAACTRAKVPAFTPGRFRHAVATWAINAGADPAVVSAFLNHKSPQTTKTFYANFAVPRKVPTLL